MCKHCKDWLKSFKWSVITYSNRVRMQGVVVLRALLQQTHTTDVWAIFEIIPRVAKKIVWEKDERNLERKAGCFRYERTGGEKRKGLQIVLWLMVMVLCREEG